MLDPSKMTWKCHVCGEERPDANISVLSTPRIVNGISITTNVRYCNDRPACIEGAQGVDFGLGKVQRGG